MSSVLTRHPRQKRSTARSVGARGRPQEVVDDDQQAAGPDEPRALGEKALGRRPVHERFDGVGEIRRRDAGAKVRVVRLDAGDAIREAGGADAVGGDLRLERTERDAGAADGRQPLGKVAERRADAAPEIHEVQRGRGGRCERSREAGNRLVNEVKRLLPRGDARPPHRPMDDARAAALSVAQKRARVPVVVAANVGGLEARD